MKENFIKYNIEDIINQKLYKEKVIDENTYRLVKNKLLRLIYESDKSIEKLIVQGESNDLI